LSGIRKKKFNRAIELTINCNKNQTLFNKIIINLNKDVFKQPNRINSKGKKSRKDRPPEMNQN